MIVGGLDTTLSDSTGGALLCVFIEWLGNADLDAILWNHKMTARYLV